MPWKRASATARALDLVKARQRSRQPCGGAELPSWVVPISLPTPYPIGPVTLYLLVGEPLTLVDTGPATAAAWGGLQQALAARALRPEDVRRVLITHGHHDHFGLAHRLSVLGAELLAHPHDRRNLALDRNYPMLWRQLGQAGLPVFERLPLIAGLRLLDRTARPVVDVTWLAAGQELPHEHGRIRVHHLPGHTPGHVGFELCGEGVVVTGDTILDGLTPYAVVDADPENPGRPFPSLAAYGATLAPWQLEEPIDPFEACALFRDLSTSAPHGRLLFKLWVCSLPSDQRTKPPLVFPGPVGSGKTRVARGIFELYGLPPRIAAVLKNGDGDFWAAMDGGGLACFDNADTRIDWLADALAAAATAGTLEKRRLYTDSDRVSLKARSWLCVTSASPTFAADSGLADRLLVVRLNRREGATAETALSDEILAHRDAGLSWIAQTLSRALADHEAVPDGLNARHPDFARLAVRIGRAIGCEAQAVAALRAAEADKGLFNLENDSIGAALLELLQAGAFNGTAAELLERLTEIDQSFAGKLSAKRLSKRLDKLWPHLESVCKAQSDPAHGGILRFSFQKPSGGFGGFETVFSGKSLRGENNNTLAEKPIESHQTHPKQPVWPRQEEFLHREP